VEIASVTSTGRTARIARAIGAVGCALALATAAAASAQTTAPLDSSGVSATLEQCVTSTVQAERSATFSGEMTSIPGAVRLSMRIDVEERDPGELEFHTVSAQGQGTWRAADPKVKVYKYLRQVTNLSSPGAYRGLVRFRWINAKGHVIKRAERLTTRCVQSAQAEQPTGSTPPSSSGSGATPPATAGTAPSA
jgi:hypothetical protein